MAVKAGGRTPSQHLKSGDNLWVDSLVHDADMLEYLCKKIKSSRILLGSDYPFPLGEVPVAGEMLFSNESLSKFLTWHERAQMLAGNAINFLKLDQEFNTAYERRLRACLGDVESLEPSRL